MLTSILSVLVCGARAESLEQNWSPKMKSDFAFTPQGSKIIPYDWARALTGADGRPFFTSANLSRYGYLAEPASAANPDALPVGFVRDDTPGGQTRYDAWMGRVPNFQRLPQLEITCAGCHTSELSHRGTKFRVFGGPSYSNFQLFVEDMDRAVSAVATDNEVGGKNFGAFAAFGAEVARRVKRRPGRKFLDRLRVDLAAFHQHRQQWEGYNGHARAGIDYGPVRNDAFGVIFNQALATFTGVKENARVPNAPVKYPVLWDTPQHEVVQWLGLARNSEAAGGPIARNIGQVLGVFGHSDVGANSWIKGYCTSAKRAQLNALESWVASLRSPRWPKDAFGFDVDRARRGQALYQRNCVSCHALPERTRSESAAHAAALGATGLVVSMMPSADGRKANERMISIDKVGTDDLVYQNAAKCSALTGVLEGRPVKVITGRKMDREEPAVTLLRHVVAGSILGSFSYLTCENTPRDGGANRGLAAKVMGKIMHFTPEDTDLPNFGARMSAFGESLHNYKARPLNGLWAAPPYLHNGSVRSLAQLLTKPADRETEFAFSCNEFDPVAVGLDCSRPADDTRVTPNDFVFSTSIPGNSNRGHDFGTALSADEKLDLIEYVKAL